MVRLFVMRHAKSSWAVPGARDFDRELNQRGRDDLVKVSAELARLEYVPELILCSSATRTRQTLEGIVSAMKPEPRVEYYEELYSGGVDDYIKLVQAAGDVGSIMTIGHNPMSAMLANTLADGGNENLLMEIAYKYPTSTVAVIDFEIDDWTKIDHSKGRLHDCILPSRL